MSRKNSSSEIPQFTFDEHHHGPRIDSTRTHQAAFAAQHAFVHLFIDALIFAPAHERMEFAEIEIRKVAGRTGRRTAAAADAGLQFGHLAQDLVALAQVVAVDEIGTSEDIAALSYALTSGCSLLATIHGETLSQVRQKKEFQAVFENRMFERYILLDNLFHPGKCLAVYDKEGKTIWK